MRNPLIVYKQRPTTKGVIVHDSHSSPAAEGVMDVDRWHLKAYDGALQMGLLGIGYHFIIERDGVSVEGRPHDRYGSHCPGFNDEWLGLCLVGGRDHAGKPEDNFGGKQRAGAFATISALEGIYGPLDIKGRYEVQRFRNKGRPNSPFLDMDEFRQDYLIFKQMGVVL